jgi:hypothetical protein
MRRLSRTVEDDAGVEIGDVGEAVFALGPSV